MAPVSKDTISRKTDLEQSIRESHSLIREYEDIIRLSNRPREKLDARSAAATSFHRLLQDYFAKLWERSMECPLARGRCIE